MSRGFTLLETAAAAAVLSVATFALLFALSGAARFAGQSGGPLHDAAAALAESTLRDAAQSWKYGSPGNAPAGTFSTTVPLAAAGESPAPVSVSVAISSITTGAASIMVRVSYTPDPNHVGQNGTVAIDGTLLVRAPLPGSQVVKPGLIPLPSGTP